MSEKEQEQKLYQVDVEVTFEMVVAAESAEEARMWAEENYKDGLYDTCYPGVWGSVLGNKPLDKCPKDWKGVSPYNAPQNKTVDQYFDA
jgi:hypothetical protein